MFLNFDVNALRNFLFLQNASYVYFSVFIFLTFLNSVCLLQKCVVSRRKGGYHWALTLRTFVTVLKNFSKRLTPNFRYFLYLKFDINGLIWSTLFPMDCHILRNVPMERHKSLKIKTLRCKEMTSFFYNKISNMYIFRLHLKLIRWSFHHSLVAQIV